METRSYPDWESHIPLDTVFARKPSLRRTFIEYNDDMVFWLEHQVNGTSVVMARKGDKIEQISPEGINVRSAVHEYGGRPYVVGNKHLYFSNFADHRLYMLDLQSREYHAITPETNSDESVGRYVAPVLQQDVLIFAYEKAYSDRENENYLACITLDGNMNEPTILVEGEDFYGDLVLHGNKLAWLAWKKPHMPWESCLLYYADLDAKNMKVDSIVEVTPDPKTSASCPRFDGKGNLYYIADYYQKETDDPYNWWNIYRYSLEEGITTPITQAIDREFGQPQWVVGMQNLEILGDGNLLASSFKKGMMQLSIIDTETLEEQIIDLGSYTMLASFRYTPFGIILNAAGMESSMVLLLVQQDGTFDLFHSVSEPPKYALTFPEFITFKTDENISSYLYYYKPSNPLYKASEGELPPAIVMVHGGPTGQTSPILDLSYQYLLSSGFAIIDIDHRGSTGYGRKYRDFLEHNWGITEMEDMYQAIQYCQQEQLISDKLFITGGSAGGYSVQRALTLYPDLFSAGASYYGIGNLFTLFEMAMLHHKFEAYYGVYLFGGMPDEKKQIYLDRSPVNHFAKLRTPMILFQGLDDRVVHPEVSREIAKELEKKGIKHDLIEYEGEGHGFRKLENRKDSILRELAFYREFL